MAMTREEAVKFTTDVLEIPPSYINKSLCFLNTLIKEFQCRIPFQTITACCVPHQERHLPTWPEIKQDLFKKVGGLCYQLHYFFKEVLVALGFGVHFISASIKRPNDHITIIASNVTQEGSRHLVEVGCGYPTFQAIPLDFESESPEYTSSFLRHKFVKRTDGIITWCHEPKREYRPFSPEEISRDGWYSYAEINADQPRDLDYFIPGITLVFTVEEKNAFLLAPRAVYFKDEMFVAIKDRHLITMEGERKLKMEEITSIGQLLDLYLLHFPHIPQDLIKRAVDITPFTI